MQISKEEWGQGIRVLYVDHWTLGLHNFKMYDSLLKNRGCTTKLFHIGSYRSEKQSRQILDGIECLDISYYRTKNIGRILDYEKPDVIIALNHFELFERSLFKAAHNRSIPCIYVMHGIRLEDLASYQQFYGSNTGLNRRLKKIPKYYDLLKMFAFAHIESDLFFLLRKKLYQLAWRYVTNPIREIYQPCRRPPELHEELAGNTAHEGGWEEYGDQREGRRDDCQADLVGRLHGRLVGRLALAQVTHDVFDLDDGVVHQDPHHQGHGEQGHDIQGETHQIHRREGRNRRQRQCCGGDESRPRVAQEQPNYQHGEHCPFDQELHRPFVVFDDRIDEIEGLDDLDAGILALQLVQRGEHAVSHLDLARPPAARDLEADHQLAVEQCRGSLLADGVSHRRHLVKKDAPPVRQHDVHRRQLVGTLHRRDGAHRLFDPADVRPTARRFLLHRTQLPRNVGGCHVERQHARRVELDANLTRHATDPCHGTNAAPGKQCVTNGVVHEPRKRLVVHPRRGDRVGQDRRTCHADLADHGVLEVGRQFGADA